MTPAPAPVPFVAATLRALCGAGDRVLDVGCGPALYRDVVPGEYVGLDITDEPYADGVPRRVDVVAPADAIPLPDASFDLVFALSAFYAMPDPAAALAEMRRVLRAGGTLVLFDYNRRMQRQLSEREGAARPGWTALGLRARVRQAGFVGSRLLVAAERQPTGLARLARLADEELRGQWAVVSATAP